MSIGTQDRPHVEPIAGPLFRAAACAPLPADDHEADNRKLLALIAAFADAGESSPRARDLVRRVGFTGEYRFKRLDKRLRELQRGGVLVVHWGDQSKKERNRYELRLEGRVER